MDSDEAGNITGYHDAKPILADDSIPQDASVKSAVDAFKKPIDNLGSEVVGTSPKGLPRDSGPEMTMGNVIADAMLAYTARNQTVAAFMNRGGVRAPIEPGPITYGEIIATQPFGNTLVVMDASGDEIRQMLNIGATKAGTVQVSRGMAYRIGTGGGAGGFAFTLRPRRAPTTAMVQLAIDLGLKEFATLSDGRTVAPPQSYRAIEAKLAIAQRAGNKRRVRALHARAANVRRDFHHKLSTSLARDYAFIAVGNVNAKRLAKTRMAKSVLDAGWSSFRNMLAYKAARFVEVDENFTTQTCSSCGALPPERPKGIAGLGIRSWDCSACGASHDRDVNAALNILRIGRSVTPLVEGSRMLADRPES